MNQATAELPIAAPAQGQPPKASPLAAAGPEAARAAVERLTSKMAELKSKGPGCDPILLARLKVELEEALQKLRRADLEAAELTAAAAGSVSLKVLGKVRRGRRKVEALNAGAMALTGEHQRGRDHLGGLKSQIAELKASGEFRQDQEEIRNEYLFPRDAETRDHPAPARGGKKTPRSVIKLAEFERAAETAAAELKITVAAQIAASERWQAEKAVLDSWEQAIRAMGPAARAVLDAMPRPGADTMGAVTNQVDFRLGVPGHTNPII